MLTPITVKIQKEAVRNIVNKWDFVTRITLDPDDEFCTGYIEFIYGATGTGLFVYSPEHSYTIQYYTIIHDPKQVMSFIYGDGQ